MRRIPTAEEPEILTPREVETLVNELAVVCEATDFVRLAYLHGAHARGTQTHLSDVDIAVLLDGAAAGDIHARLDILASMQDACGREDIDLLILNEAGPIIKNRVIRYGRLIFERSQRERMRFEETVIKEALDFQYFSRQYDDALFQQLSKGRFLD
jgi:predicted nucleotidyltransferase